MFDNYLCETNLLDFKSEAIQNLIKERKWRNLEALECIESIYNFVKNEILFGYNKDDMIKSSEVLNDGYGQCNTKAILLMSLLRGSGIPCRIHGFTVDKLLQFGVMPNYVYKRSPNNIIHSWVEVYINSEWIVLEGIILDDKYLSGLKKKLKGRTGAYMGYGVGVNDFEHINVDFTGVSTYIQSTAINMDYGIYNSPDEFFPTHHQEISKFKGFLYRNIGRKSMNRRVAKIRKYKN